MHLTQCFKMPSRRLGIQLFKTAKPIPYRRCIDAIAARADQVMLAITDHQGLRRVQAFFLKQVRPLTEKENAFFTYSAANYVKLKDLHLAEGYDQL